MINKLEGTFVYVQLQTPTDCYERQKGKEWKCSIVVDEDTADEWEEIFPKQAAKAVKTSEFEGIYKIPAPISDAKKQYVITLRKNTKLGNGNEVPEMYQPKVLIPNAGGYKDVTQEVLPGNGSIGTMSVDVWESEKGPVARLKNILVTDMIVYERAEGSSYNPGDEFGDASSAPKPAAKPAAKSAPAKKAAAKKAEPEPEPEAEEDEDAPF